MDINVLTEDLLLEVLKLLPPAALAASACVCQSWCRLSSNNMVWNRHLKASSLPKDKLEAVAARGPEACRDYWLMQHWLHNALLIETWHTRSKHVREGHRVSNIWRRRTNSLQRKHGSAPGDNVHPFSSMGHNVARQQLQQAGM